MAKVAASRQRVNTCYLNAVLAIEIISFSISTKVWHRARIKLATPGSAVRHVSAGRHVIDCTTRPCRERSGSVVECLTRDRRAAVRASPASLRCVLEQEH